MKSEEVQGARRTARERQRAANEADRAAMARKRSGRQPTKPTEETGLRLSIAPNGARETGVSKPSASPEQTARGEEVEGDDDQGT